MAIPAWMSSYVKGSFRGVPFFTEDHDQSGGRRGTSHEFPQRDDPWFEDLGRRARERSITMFLLGDDVYDQRDAMVAALEAKGAGILVHPFLGQLDVVCTDYTLSETTREGGIARFTMQFAEAGRLLAGEVNDDSAEAARTVGAAENKAAIARFEAEFSVAGLPEYAVDGALGDVERFARDALTSGKILGGAGKALRAFESGIDGLEGALDLVYAPARLAQTVTAMVRGIAALGISPLLRLRALTRLFESQRRPRTIIGMTPVRIAERANSAALAQNVAVVSAAEAVRVMSGIGFASRDEAIALRTPLADALDAAATDYADGGFDAAAAALDHLRHAMVRDVAARGSSLAPIRIVTPSATEPLLVIINRVYGTRGFDARVGEVAARNAITHPGFVSGGVALELLSETSRG